MDATTDPASGQPAPSYADAMAQLVAARTELAKAQTAADKQNALANLDKATASLQSAAASQQRASAATSNAATNATKASNQNANQQKALSIKAAANAALQQYHDELIAAKGDANQINLAKARYDTATKLIDQRVNQLKDEMTADTSLDVNADTGSVNQADSRNEVAMNAMNNAASRMEDVAKGGGWSGMSPEQVGGAMAGLMQAGSAFSDATGGAAVDPQQLALKHKLEIADLVLNKGVSFRDALSTVAGSGQKVPGQLNDAMGIAGGYTAGGQSTGSTASGFAPGGGIVGQNTGGGGGNPSGQPGQSGGQS